MTITEVDLIKHEGTTDENGSGFDVEYDITYTGAYDPFVVKALNSITHNGSPVDLEIGADIAYDAGIYLRRRKPRVIDSIATGGSFTLELTYRDGIQYVENPLSRKDVAKFRRYDESREYFEDRLGRPIASYKIEEGVGDDPDLWTPIEIFANKPTTNIAKFSATINGFRDGYYLSFDDQSEFNIVNDAPVTIDGLTFAARTVRYAGGEAGRDRINGYPCIPHTWQLEMKPSWKLRVVNQGNYELKDGERIRIFDPATKTMRTSAWPIGLDGLALPPNYAAASIAWLEFDNVIEVDFSYFDWTF